MKMKINFILEAAREKVGKEYPEWERYERNKNGQIYDESGNKIKYPEESFNMELVEKGQKKWRKVRNAIIAGEIVGGCVIVGGTAYGIISHNKSKKEVGSETEEQPKIETF